MAQTIHFLRDAKELKKRTLLLDANVLPYFFDVDARAAAAAKGHLPIYTHDPRCDAVKRFFRGRLYASWATALECVRFGDCSPTAAKGVLELVTNTVKIEERSPAEVNRDVRDAYAANAYKFSEAELWGALDIYTATVAIRFGHVVLTRDVQDFDKIPRVEYLVGWT